MPDDALFDRLDDYVEQGTQLVARILGDLYDTLDESTTIGRLCQRVACLAAYEASIPHLDLVLTDNGFGVVSNQNVAPASMDRVRRLQQRVKDSRDDAIDDLIDELRGNADWSSSTEAIALFASLVWNARHQLPMMGFPDGHRTQLTELRPKINAAEEVLRQKMSDSLFNELCSALRLREVAGLQGSVISKALFFIGAHIAGDSRAARFHLAKLVEFLEAHLTEFPTYTASTAHQANAFTPYENKKDDTTYFFG
jgi:hypothetical protein